MAMKRKQITLIDILHGVQVIAILSFIISMLVIVF